MTNSSKDRRNALLGELESIRTLLQEDANIPLLIPEDHSQASNLIPVLSVPLLATVEPLITPLPAADPLQAIRQAAAKVVANTGRQRATVASTRLSQSAETAIAPLTTVAAPTTTLPAIHDREKLVDEIVRSALPRLETLLRELVQEALLQEKLRSGKR